MPRLSELRAGDRRFSRSFQGGRHALAFATVSAGLALIFDVLASWFVTAAGSNPQDRSGSSNRQDMTQPRAINPQDMR
jgi:hypothetical protein